MEWRVRSQTSMGIAEWRAHVSTRLQIRNAWSEDSGGENTSGIQGTGKFGGGIKCSLLF